MFIKYYPIGLINFYVYQNKNISLDEVISFLKSLIDYLNSNQKNKKIRDLKHIPELFKIIDDKYYNDEIIKAEIYFLSIFDNGYGLKFPKGLSRFYFENPLEYQDILKNEYESYYKDLKLKENILSLIFQITHRYIFPNDICLEGNKLSVWVETILVNVEDEEYKKFLYRSLGRNLASIAIKNLVPDENVLAIIEKYRSSIMLLNYEIEVTNSFGMRAITADGKPQKQLAETYDKLYQRFAISYPFASQYFKYMKQYHLDNGNSDYNSEQLD